MDEIERLTRERDEAQRELARLNACLSSVTAENQYRAQREADALQDWQALRAERDEAQEELENLQETICGFLPYKYDDGEDDDANAEERVEYAAQEIQELTRQRDEARAEVERLKEFYQPKDDSLRERIHAAMDRAKERHAREQVEHAQAMKDAYRRGAEAMREACVGTACAQDLDPDTQDRMEDCLRALPIPEDK